MPRMQSLNHPATSFAAWMKWQRFIAPVLRRDVPFVVLAQHNFVRGSIIIGRIQAQMVRLIGCWLRTDNDLISQQGLQHWSIVDVRRRDDDRQRNSATVAQNMVFHASFSAIRRVGAAFFSPPTVTAHKCHHLLATASQCRGAGRRDINSVATCLQTPRRAPIRRSDHRRSATGRTLWASPATAHPSRECRAWRPEVLDHQHGCARPSCATVPAELKFRAPPTSHQVLFAVLACPHLT